MRLAVGLPGSCKEALLELAGAGLLPSPVEPITVPFEGSLGSGWCLQQQFTDEDGGVHDQLSYVWDVAELATGVRVFVFSPFLEELRAARALGDHTVLTKGTTRVRAVPFEGRG